MIADPLTDIALLLRQRSLKRVEEELGKANLVIDV